MDAREAKIQDRPLAAVRDQRRQAEREQDERRQRRRAQRFEARNGLRYFTRVDAIRDCGWTSIRNGGPVLRVTYDQGGSARAGWSGISTCSSVWACPECAEKIQVKRREELLQLITTATARGASVVLVTLTMRHSAGDRLGELWDDLSSAWAAINRDGSYRRHRDEYGLIGWVKAVEVTLGEHGWHVHIHALMILHGPCSQERAEAFGELLWAPWSRYLSNRPGRAPVREAFDVRVGRGALAGMGDYLAKAIYWGDDQDDDGPLVTDNFRESYQGLASEMTLSSHKQGRIGSRTPFQLLRDILSAGMRTADGKRVIAADPEDLRRWSEWEQASRRRRQLTWSKGLREWAQLGEEATDEELATEEAGGEDLIGLPLESWRAVRGQAWLLLDLAETGGLTAVTRYLDGRGLEWFYAVAAPPRERLAG